MMAINGDDARKGAKINVLADQHKVCVQLIRMYVVSRAVQ